MPVALKDSKYNVSNTELYFGVQCVVSMCVVDKLIAHCLLMLMHPHKVQVLNSVLRYKDV
jgi:hypothetical protein